MWAYHRIAIVQMAEISLEFGMAGKGKRMIEGCLPQILNGDDLEIRAYACDVLARCTMAESWSDDDPKKPPPPERQTAALEEALPFLHVAKRDYTTIGMYLERLHAIYTLSVVYHNLALGYQAIIDKDTSKRDEDTGEPDVSVDREALKKKVEDNTRQRDLMAEMYLEVDKEKKEVGSLVMDEELKEVLDLVVKAAAVISR